MVDLEKVLPDLTTSWNKLDLNDPAINAWIMETEQGKQVVLMHFLQYSFSDEFHINDCSQWGVVLDGEMTLWTDQKRVLKRGDIFIIPEGMPHRVKINAGYKDLTVFDGLRYESRLQQRKEVKMKSALKKARKPQKNVGKEIRRERLVISTKSSINRN